MQTSSCPGAARLRTAISCLFFLLFWIGLSGSFFVDPGPAVARARTLAVDAGTDPADYLSLAPGDTVYGGGGMWPLQDGVTYISSPPGTVYERVYADSLEIGATLIGYRVTGRLVSDDPIPFPYDQLGLPPPTACVEVFSSRVRFVDCVFEEMVFEDKGLWFDPGEAAKRYVAPPGGAATIRVVGGEADFERCTFRRNERILYLSEGPAYGCIATSGPPGPSSRLRFRGCHFVEQPSPVWCSGEVLLEGCTFENCGPGLLNVWGSLEMSGNLITGSGPCQDVWDYLTGLYLYDEALYYSVVRVSGTVVLERNTFVENPMLFRAYGEAWVLTHPPQEYPALVEVEDGSAGVISHNLFVGMTGPAVEAPVTVEMRCNDAWDSDVEVWAGGIGDVTGLDGNLSVAPLFCDRAGGDWHLCQDSPAAIGDCGLMGALPATCECPVAVAVRSFEARWEERGVAVRWDLAEPGVIVLRRARRGEAPVEVYRGQGREFVDLAAPSAGDDLRYGLGWIREDGSEVLPLAWTKVEGTPARARTRILGAAPNPFNPSTVVAFELAQPGDAVLSIHDAAGHRVRTWRWTDLASGEHRVKWLGLDDQERPVAAGVYHLRLESGGRAVSGRVVLLK